MTGGGDDLFARPSGAIRLTDAQRLDWLRLSRSENVGPRTFRDLINLYGGAAQALEALPDLSRRGGKGTLRITSRAEAEREMALSHRHGVAWIAWSEPDYPPLLLRTAAPPPLLGIRGDPRVLVQPAVGIVGSRNASVAGLKMAGLLARDLGAMGYAIVSGLARGIDAAAHQASLSSGTVAVLAGGHDRIYPPEHDGLLAAIMETGCAVSEMPMGHEPRAKDFPRRNRLIAGLSLGIVVVEAAERSGSLITARMALEENREVFAVPGSPLDPRAAGTNRLIRQGAVLVTGAADVAEVLAPLARRAEPPTSAEEEEEEAMAGPTDPGEDARARILALLGPTPASIDDIVRASGLTVQVVRVVLLELELAGRVVRDRAGAVALV